MVPSTPSGLGVSEAFKRFLELQEAGFPEQGLQALLRECVKQGEGFCEQIGLRISLATDLPAAVVDAVDRVLNPRRTPTARTSSD